MAYIHIYSLVELCDYGDSKDRIIRDALIIECNKIVQKGEKIKLNEVIEILPNRRFNQADPQRNEF